QLADCYGVSTSLAERQALRSLVGGHPYLLAVAFYTLRQEKVSLTQLIEEAPTAAGIYHHHLQACLKTLQQQPTLAEALRWVVMSPNPVELESAHAHQLASLGIVTLEGNACRPACELYRLFFTHHGLPASSHQAFFQQLRAENEQLKVLANLDGLTQLANRRMFDAQFQQDWQRARQQGSRLSLIMLDIDCFKLYNDTYGHPAGDDCLRRVSQLLHTLVHREWLRHKISQVSNTVARYGGEEFVVILPELTATTVVRMADELRGRIRALQIPHKASLLSGKVVTSSIGVASIVPSYDTSPTQLLAAADSALYISKQQGRDRVSVNDIVNHHTPRVGEVRC
ncbi:MAG: diguanylate cyclase, partial [Cyanobacteria bacterium J06576_12]